MALAVLQDKAVTDRLADLGFDPAAADGTVFGRLFDRTVDTFAGIARERSNAAGNRDRLFRSGPLIASTGSFVQGRAG